MYIETDPSKELDTLRERLVVALLYRSVRLTEGLVMSMGPPPYRRIDCKGRAVVYLRSRPRKKVVRADVSGLWVICPEAKEKAKSIIIRSATGGATLMLSSSDEIELAVNLIIESVNHTLTLEEEYNARHAQTCGD